MNRHTLCRQYYTYSLITTEYHTLYNFIVGLKPLHCRYLRTAVSVHRSAPVQLSPHRGTAVSKHELDAHVLNREGAKQATDYRQSAIYSSSS